MPEALHFTEKEKAVLRKAHAPTATDDQWGLFILECERRQLMPGKDVVFQLRTTSEWNAELRQKTFSKKVILITTIGGLRLIAERCGKYEGHSPFIWYYGIEGGELRESKIPLGKIPHAVSVDGYRKDWKVPLFATARYDAYVQMQGKDEDRKPTQMWATRGEEQLAKCAEAQMLRTVAPEECAGLYINEEVNDIISKEEQQPEVPVTPAVIPQATVAPAVNQQPAPPAAADFFAPPTTPVSPQPVPPPPAPVAPAPVQQADSDAASAKEVAEFLARASKIVRDKLPKAGMKDQEASQGVKNYLLKQSGKPSFRVISKPVFERLLKVLEDAATPEDAAAIVRAGCK